MFHRNKQGNRTRGLALNLLLCTSSVSIFLGGSELLAQLKYTPQKLEYKNMFEYDREKVFGLRKNNDDIYHGGHHTTNSFGSRGKEISQEKLENTVRVLVGGDSVSFGHGVNENETYSYFLEQPLNRYLAGEEEVPAFEVINTAVPGNSPFQEYHDMKRGLAYDHDIIVLQTTLNDIIEENAGWILEDIGMEEGNPENVSRDFVFGKQNMPSLDNALRQNGPPLFQDFWEVFFLDYDHLSPTGLGLVANILQPVILNTLHLAAE